MPTYLLVILIVVLYVVVASIVSFVLGRFSLVKDPVDRLLCSIFFPIIGPGILIFTTGKIGERKAMSKVYSLEKENKELKEDKKKLEEMLKKIDPAIKVGAYR